MWLSFAALVCGAVVVHLSWLKKFKRTLLLQEQALARMKELQKDIQDETLAQAESQQRALLDSMVEGLLLLDSEGRIQIANRALEKLFSVMTRDISGKTIIEAFRNHELASMTDRLANESQILGFEMELSELQPHWFQVNAAAITDSRGKRHGMIFVFHDLTRLKQLENNRREFVANVSHELRTPLSMIKGYVETLIDGAKDNSEVAGKFLQIIEKHTDRLTFLIEDLLTISKLESGQIILNRQPCDLHLLVGQVIRSLQSHIEERRMLMDNQIPSELCADADADRLEQVFWNLLENAIKYGRSGGCVTISGHRTDKAVHISVKDYCPGIPTDSQGRIFERFYRVDKPRSRDLGGTGLGLAIVKHVVQSHGGEVWIESELDRGTTFHFTLPGK